MGSVCLVSSQINVLTVKKQDIDLKTPLSVDKVYGIIVFHVCKQFARKGKNWPDYCRQANEFDDVV